MHEVIAAFKITANEYMIICEGEKPLQVGVKLQTDVGSFAASEYAVGWCSQRITDKSAYAIRIKTDKDCSKITTVRF